MQFDTYTDLILSGSFGIFLRNMESSIRRKSNALNFIMLSQRFKLSLPDNKHFFERWKKEVKFFTRFDIRKPYFEEPP